MLDWYVSKGRVHNQYLYKYALILFKPCDVNPEAVFNVGIIKWLWNY